MNNFLAEITANKLREIEESKSLVPVKKLEKSIYFDNPTVKLTQYLRREDRFGVIAEFKRRSPSEGPLNPHLDLEKTTIGYMQAGASALSVLTDKRYFGGCLEDLQIARKFNFCPILRKDFILDEYQLLEARSYGADVVLLIAAAINKSQVKKLAAFARDLGMEVLLEIREEGELDYLNEYVDLVGINNRNLKDLQVNIDQSLMLADHIPEDSCKISESGISHPDTLIQLKNAGFDGFLIGSAFMRSSRPHETCRRLIRDTNARFISPPKQASS